VVAQSVYVHSPSSLPQYCGYRHPQPDVVVVGSLVVVVGHAHSVVVVVLVVVVAPGAVVVVVLVDVEAAPHCELSSDQAEAPADQTYLHWPEQADTPSVVVVVLVAWLQTPVSGSASTTHCRSAF
jgi:hypothetical protein